MKNKTAIIIIFSITFAACEKKLSICECMDLKASLTDSMTLSKDELEEKRKGCEWVERELSPLEITQKFLECNGSSSNSYSEKCDTCVENNTSIKNEIPKPESEEEKSTEIKPVIPLEGIAFSKNNAYFYYSPNSELKQPVSYIESNILVNYTYNPEYPEWIYVKIEKEVSVGGITEGWSQIINFNTFTEKGKPLPDPGFF